MKAQTETISLTTFVEGNKQNITLHISAADYARIAAAPTSKQKNRALVKLLNKALATEICEDE